MGRPRVEKIAKEDLRQVPFRMHENDYKVLKRLMADDGLTFQSLVRSFVEEYMRGNPLVMKVLKARDELESVPQEVKDRFTLSQRERQELLKQLEAESDKELL